MITNKKLLTVKVTGIFEAKSEAKGWADHVVSLIDPNFKDHLGSGSALNMDITSHHIEGFDDVEEIGSTDKDGITIHGYAPPTEDHIKRILEFTDKFLDCQNILVHCHAGICRSTAVAILIHCQAGFSPEEAFKRVEEARPQLWPNRLVISLGDELLGLNGELVNVVANFMVKEADTFWWGGEKC